MIATPGQLAQILREAEARRQRLLDEIGAAEGDLTLAFEALNATNETIDLAREALAASIH